MTHIKIWTPLPTQNSWICDQYSHLIDTAHSPVWSQQLCRQIVGQICKHKAKYYNESGILFLLKICNSVTSGIIKVRTKTSNQTNDFYCQCYTKHNYILYGFFFFRNIKATHFFLLWFVCLWNMFICNLDPIKWRLRAMNDVKMSSNDLNNMGHSIHSKKLNMV